MYVHICMVVYCMSAIQNNTKMIFKNRYICLVGKKSKMFTQSVIDDRRYRTKHKIRGPDIGQKIANMSEYSDFGIGFSLAIRISLPSKYST
jgi:hypothetical protein